MAVEAQSSAAEQPGTAVEAEASGARQYFDIWKVLDSLQSLKGQRVETFVSRVQVCTSGRKNWKWFKKSYAVVYDTSLITRLLEEKEKGRNVFYIFFVGLYLMNYKTHKTYIVLHCQEDGVIYCREVVRNKDFVARDEDILRIPETNFVRITVEERGQFKIHHPSKDSGYAVLGTPPPGVVNPTGFTKARRAKRSRSQQPREAKASESSEGSSVEEDGQTKPRRQRKKRQEDADFQPPSTGAAGGPPASSGSSLSSGAVAGAAGSAASQAGVESASMHAASAGAGPAPAAEAAQPEAPAEPLPPEFNAMLLSYNRRMIVEALAQRDDAQLFVLDLKSELRNNGKAEEFAKLIEQEEKQPEAAGAALEAAAPISVPMPGRAIQRKGADKFMVGENLHEYMETHEQRSQRFLQMFEEREKAAAEKKKKREAKLEEEKRKQEEEKKRKEEELRRRMEAGEKVDLNDLEKDNPNARKRLEEKKIRRHQASSKDAAEAARDALEKGRFSLPQTTYDVRYLDKHQILVLCRLPGGLGASWLKTHEIPQEKGVDYHVFFAANHRVALSVRKNYSFDQAPLPKQEQCSLDQHKLFGFPKFMVAETESEDEAKRMKSFCMRPTSECIREWNEWCRRNVKDKQGVSVHEIVEKALTEDHRKGLEQRKARDPEKKPQKEHAQRVVVIPMCFMPVCNHSGPCHDMEKTCGSPKLDNVFQQPFELYIRDGSSHVLGMIMPCSMADLCNFPPLCDLPIKS